LRQWHIVGRKLKDLSTPTEKNIYVSIENFMDIKSGSLNRAPTFPKILTAPISFFGYFHIDTVKIGV
jgi:hypothetical protein